MDMALSKKLQLTELLKQRDVLKDNEKFDPTLYRFTNALYVELNKPQLSMDSRDFINTGLDSMSVKTIKTYK